ncbi:waprin-Phi1-like [Pseudorasbora parva]|uniref:waprin-Phi1-like n=1 Tax=Pseudorasbora parva TaxID=51549 RepID=UPI00351F195E
MTALVLCAVLLCLSGCLSSTEAATELNTGNPGVCPSRVYKAEKCPLISFLSCADDSDCAENEKCCSNGCGLQCMAPVIEKPGVCPRGNIDPAVCAMTSFRWMCDYDSDCAKNEKCCHNGCVLQCMAPVTEKPGVCPSGKIDPAVCRRIRFRWMCDYDSDCAKNEKCCHNGCGLQCMAPVTGASVRIQVQGKCHPLPDGFPDRI